MLDLYGAWYTLPASPEDVHVSQTCSRTLHGSMAAPERRKVVRSPSPTVLAIYLERVQIGPEQL